MCKKLTIVHFTIIPYIYSNAIIFSSILFPNIDTCYKCVWAFDSIARREQEMSSTPRIEDLSVLALRVELFRRGLQANGLKHSLQSRLQASLAQSSDAISVPNTFIHMRQTYSHAVSELVLSQEEPHSARNTAKRTRVQPVGFWMGRSVWVMGTVHMEALWTVEDAYGKGNLSRSAPTYTTSNDASATKGKAARQLLALEKFAAKTSGVQASRDGEEHLQLTLVEAFFATFHSHRMSLVSRNGEPLTDAANVWYLFSSRVPHFAARFAAYSRYRATGWMPRSGLKYGVDWVLYPIGVEKHSHAPYCVILSFAAASMPSQIERTWIRLQNKLRLVKNVAKSLIVAEVWFSNGVQPSNWSEATERVNICEITVDRWVP